MIIQIEIKIYATQFAKPIQPKLYTRELIKYLSSPKCLWFSLIWSQAKWPTMQKSTSQNRAEWELSTHFGMDAIVVIIILQ